MKRVSTSVENEKIEVRELRKRGLTIEAIAELYGKSSYWVYTRLNDKLSCCE
jgi:transcriptional regulator